VKNVITPALDVSGDLESVVIETERPRDWPPAYQRESRRDRRFQ
jgi:hypothetical protein